MRYHRGRTAHPIQGANRYMDYHSHWRTVLSLGRILAAQLSECQAKFREDEGAMPEGSIQVTSHSAPLIPSH